MLPADPSPLGGGTQMSSSGRVGVLEPEVELREPRTGPSGARSGAILAAASAASMAINYVFLLAAGRILGSEDYGSLAALLGLLAVVLIPATTLQMAVSREISRRIASADEAGADAFARRTLWLAALATLALVGVALALAVPLAHVLRIDSVGVVVLAETALATALTLPVAMGVLQGRQRFHALAATYVVPHVLRLALFAIAAAAGYRLGGAVFATVASAVATTAVAIVLIRGPLRGGAARPRPELAEFLRYLGPVVVGLVGIALLTHVDLLIVKARFSGEEAGAYAAASAFARVGFFLPATILAVLFPRAAARQARGEDTADILGRPLIATAAFCSGLVVFYAATGVGLVSMSFGAEFAEGGEVLAPFAVAIGLFSLVNILVGYHLSRGETRYAWIVACGVAAQVAVLALVPTALRDVVWANVAVGAALLVAHELLVGSSVPAIRAGTSRLAGRSAARVRAVTLEAVAVTAASTLFVAVLMWPVVAHLGSTVVGHLGSDSTGGIWWLWQLNREGGYHLLGTTHHTLTAAPFGWDEGNGLNLQWLLPYYPAYLATKVVGEIAAFNLVMLAGYALSGAAMYLLTRLLGCSRLVSAWAGLVFIVFPWHLARAEHASLVHLEVLALLVVALVAAARHPSWERLAFVGAATLACWLTSGYFGAEAVISVLAFSVGAAAFARARDGARLVLGAGACALAATALVALGSFTSGVNRGAGLERSVDDLSGGGLRLVELVVPADEHLLLDDPLQKFHDTHLHGTGRIEVSNYLGLLTIGLALAWLAIAWRSRARLRRDERAVTAGLVLVVATGLAFGAPSPLSVFGHEVPMPARLLWEVVPAFRAPSRWTPLVMAALVPLAALGLQAVSARAARRARRPLAVSTAVVAVAALLSFLELTIRPASPRFRTTPVPAEYAAVERTPDGILAEYPLGSSDVYRFWQREHERPLLNGVTPTQPAEDARLVLLDPSTPGTAAALALLGVTSFVIHEDAVVDAEVRPRPPGTRDGYELVARLGDGDSVWRVAAAPAPAFVTLPGGFAKPRPLDDGGVGHPLVAPSGVAVVELRAKTRGVVDLVLEARPPPGQPRRLRVADAENERGFALTGATRISVAVEVPRGVSRLLVKTDPAPTSESDAVVVSAPRAEPSAGEPALRAEPTASDPGF
jgi:O-antigen/teichoic acid export membrane protein